MSILAALKAQPDSPIKVPPEAVASTYRFWRARILATSLIGYAIFYFVRSNPSVPLPAMAHDLGYTRAQLGFILTVGGVVYGVSKFANGFLGERANPRYFMAIGLLLSAAMNVWFGLSSSLFALASIWFVNNWAQGMGFPPCARNMGYWFSPKERSTTFGIWHIGHTIGAASTSVLTGYVLKYYGWRSCFFVPAGIAVGGAIFIISLLRDTPGSLGLPPIEVYKGETTAGDVVDAPSSAVAQNAPPDDTRSYGRVVLEQVFLNKYMWIISLANCFVYVLRYAFGMHWGPTLLQQMKHVSPVTSSWLNSGFETCGMVSALLGGYVADRFFGGRAGRVCFIAAAILTVDTYVFWTAEGPVLATFCFLVMGFMVYVPQMLIAAMAMNLGTQRASAAAVGMTAVFTCASHVLSGWGIGKIVDMAGWNVAFRVLLACCAVTAVLMALTWNVGAHSKEPTMQEGEETCPSRT